MRACSPTAALTTGSTCPSPGSETAPRSSASASPPSSFRDEAALGTGCRTSSRGFRSSTVTADIGTPRPRRETASRPGCSRTRRPPQLVLDGVRGGSLRSGVRRRRPALGRPVTTTATAPTRAGDRPSGRPHPRPSARQDGAGLRRPQPAGVLHATRSGSAPGMVALCGSDEGFRTTRRPWLWASSPTSGSAESVPIRDCSSHRARRLLARRRPAPRAPVASRNLTVHSGAVAWRRRGRRPRAPDGGARARYPETKDVWADVIPRLANAPRRRYDVRGAASRPRTTTRRLRPRRLTDDVLAVLERGVAGASRASRRPRLGSIQGWEFAIVAAPRRGWRRTRHLGPESRHVGMWMQDRLRHPSPPSPRPLAGQGLSPGTSACSRCRCCPPGVADRHPPSAADCSLGSRESRPPRPNAGLDGPTA